MKKTVAICPLLFKAMKFLPINHRYPKDSVLGRSFALQDNLASRITHTMPWRLRVCRTERSTLIRIRIYKRHSPSNSWSTKRASRISTSSNRVSSKSLQEPTHCHISISSLLASCAKSLRKRCLWGQWPIKRNCKASVITQSRIIQ